jgi:hypothetical protein
MRVRGGGARATSADDSGAIVGLPLPTTLRRRPTFRGAGRAPQQTTRGAKRSCPDAGGARPMCAWQRDFLKAHSFDSRRPRRGEKRANREELNGRWAHHIPQMAALRGASAEGAAVGTHIGKIHSQLEVRYDIRAECQLNRGHARPRITHWAYHLRTICVPVRAPFSEVDFAFPPLRPSESQPARTLSLNGRSPRRITISTSQCSRTAPS